jgi:hypothetical protein
MSVGWVSDRCSTRSQPSSAQATKEFSMTRSECVGDPVPVARLEREWKSLAARLQADRWSAWIAAEPCLRRFAGATHLMAFFRSPLGGKDQVLAALLRLARSDALAARLVLQALLPGLKQIAGRAVFEAAEREEFWELLLDHVWERIRLYPLERRPQRIAANLVLDSLRRTLRELKRERRRRAPLTATPIAELPAAAVVATDPELVLAAAVRAGAISKVEARLIFFTRLEGRSLAEAAAEESLPYNVARVRLQRAERRLLLHLGYRDVPKRRSKGPFSSARATGAGPAG